MEKKNYVPQPVDTTDVELPEELYPLVETMAKNVHDVWAKSHFEASPMSCSLRGPS